MVRIWTHPLREPDAPWGNCRGWPGLSVVRPAFSSRVPANHPQTQTTPGWPSTNHRLPGSRSRPRTRGFEGWVTRYLVQDVALALISGTRVFISGARVFSNDLVGTNQ